MYTKKTPILLCTLLFTGFLFAQDSFTHQSPLMEFMGKVTVEGGTTKNVLIKAIESDTCFSQYYTRSSGKMVFYGEKNKHFTLQLEKPGYYTKQIVVNTNNVKCSEREIEKFKFIINLQKVDEGDREDQYISMIDVIEVNNLGTKFRYKVNRDKIEYLSKSEQMASTF